VTELLSDGDEVGQPDLGEGDACDVVEAFRLVEVMQDQGECRELIDGQRLLLGFDHGTEIPLDVGRRSFILTKPGVWFRGNGQCTDSDGRFDHGRVETLCCR
jgi:hypothetical protein